MSSRSRGLIQPRLWSLEELSADVDEAMEIFRVERMEEPLDDYMGAFEKALIPVETILEGSVDLTDVKSMAREFLLDSENLAAFRYFSGPPISHDDLKTLVASSVAPSTLKSHPEVMNLIVQTVMMGLDRGRFPWVGENRIPSESEVKAATVATAALIAYQKSSTQRRNSSKAAQEAKTADALTVSGFEKVRISQDNITSIMDGPGPGQYCGEKKLADRKADLIVRLWDNRLLAVECKVSNSGTNSVKRVLNDAAAKATTWRQRLGEDQVVPVAVLSGVYKSHNLAQAQDRGLALIWSHRLADLTEWIDLTR